MLIIIFCNYKFLDSSGGNVNYPILMMFAGKVVYNKVVDNSLKYLMLKFGGIWPSSF
jgi:hypothetical protein